MKLDTTVAFAADLATTSIVRTEDYFAVPNWRTSGSPGLFDSTNGAFKADTGVFTVRNSSSCRTVGGGRGMSSRRSALFLIALLFGSQAPVDGIYYVACNIRIDSATEARYIRVILDVSSDGGNKYLNGLHHIRSNLPPYYSANPSGAFRAAASSCLMLSVEGRASKSDNSGMLSKSDRPGFLFHLYQA